MNAPKSNARSMPTLRYVEKFRTYQLNAIDKARQYIRECQSNSAKSGAALVYHPTGTGKTVVIAGIAHAAPEIGNVLILTTRDSIRDQLARELSGNLFISKFNLSKQIHLTKSTYVVAESRILDGTAEMLQKSTCELLKDESSQSELQRFATKQFKRLVKRPADPFTTELTHKRSIVIMNVQMLVGMRREEKDAYRYLRDHIDVVLFDEGHYEPAVKYSAATRDLGKPIVLMSATPFRNDLKPFKIAENDIHIYKFGEAVADKVIREVTIVPRPESATRDTRTFCLDIIAYCKSMFTENLQHWPRIIIHCDNGDDIKKLGETFIENGFLNQVVGIHDTFKPSQDGHRPWHHQAVPPPRQTDKLIWIHQYKLMEGIDDHRFRVLAFYELLGNERSVIQQIGRVIRKTNGANDPAIVLDHHSYRVKKTWDLYLKYDKLIDEKTLSLNSTKHYVEKILSLQTKIDYVQQKFRRSLNIDENPDIIDEILFERRVTLKQTHKNATIAFFRSQVEEMLAIEDYEYCPYFPDDNAVLYILTKSNTPEFFDTSYFTEVRVGILLLKLLPEYGILAIATTGEAPASVLNTLTPVDPDQLGRLMMPGKSGRVCVVTSKNSNLGNRVVRGRTISAPSIADIPPILDEYGHIVSAVTGYNGTVPRVTDETSDDEATEALLRRYIGISSGRVSEAGTSLHLQAFQRWVKSLADQMRSAERSAEVFDRYAALAHLAVENGVANNLLLDIFDISDQYKLKTNGEKMRGDELCVDLEPLKCSKGKPVSTGKVTINDKLYKVNITFDKKAQRYRVDSPELGEDFDPVDRRTKPIVRELNESQSFSIIPEDRHVIYVHGRFYAPGLKFGKRFSEREFFTGHCLYPSHKLLAIKSEKGACILEEKDEYDPKCLFNLIDSWKNGFDTEDLNLDQSWTIRNNVEPISFEPSLCICDDTNSENADFILADVKGRRVVLVHAKASKKYRPFSASAVQDVCVSTITLIDGAACALFEVRSDGPASDYWWRVFFQRSSHGLPTSRSRTL